MIGLKKRDRNSSMKVSAGGIDTVKPSFYMAIQGDCIRENPFEFKFSDILDDATEEKIEKREQKMGKRG